LAFPLNKVLVLFCICCVSSSSSFGHLKNTTISMLNWMRKWVLIWTNETWVQFPTLNADNRSSKLLYKETLPESEISARGFRKRKRDSIDFYWIHFRAWCRHKLLRRFHSFRFILNQLQCYNNDTDHIEIKN